MNNRERRGTLDSLIKRQANVKAALKEIQARRRAQEKEDRLRIEALIGFAVMADLEAVKPPTRGEREAYIREVLERYISSGHDQSFVRTKGLAF